MNRAVSVESIFVRMVSRGQNGPIHRRTLTGGNRCPVTQAGNVVQPFPRLRDYHPIPGIYVRVPEDRTSGLWQDHDSIRTAQSMPGAEGCEDVFARVQKSWNFLRERREPDAPRYSQCGSPGEPPRDPRDYTPWRPVRPGGSNVASPRKQHPASQGIDNFLRLSHNSAHQ